MWCAEPSLLKYRTHAHTHARTQVCHLTLLAAFLSSATAAAVDLAKLPNCSAEAGSLTVGTAAFEAATSLPEGCTGGQTYLHTYIHTYVHTSINTTYVRMLATPDLNFKLCTYVRTYVGTYVCTVQD